MVVLGIYSSLPSLNMLTIFILFCHKVRNTRSESLRLGQIIHKIQKYDNLLDVAKKSRWNFYHNLIHKREKEK